MTNGFTWEKLPYQREIFGFDYIVGDGATHNLASTDRMPQFQEHWKPSGGLLGFQKHLGNELARISEKTTV